jgi:hypothetical protein
VSGIGKNIRGENLMMLQNPAAGGKLPAQIKVLQGVEASEESVDQRHAR